MSRCFDRHRYTHFCFKHGFIFTLFQQICILLNLQTKPQLSIHKFKQVLSDRSTKTLSQISAHKYPSPSKMLLYNLNQILLSQPHMPQPYHICVCARLIKRHPFSQLYISLSCILCFFLKNTKHKQNFSL